MATRAQIITVRLEIDDPAGFIDIKDIADSSLLPAIPAQQTAYYLEDIEHYVSTFKESGAVAADYTQVQLYLSDGLIGGLIDLYGVDKAVCYCYGKILAKLASQLPLQETQTGTERTKYTTLTEKRNHYKKLHDECMAKYNANNNNNTGQALRSRNVIIAGGEV